MQTLTLSSSKHRVRRLPDPKPRFGLRALRFLSDRYAHRERPGVAAEFTLLAVIILTTTWPLISLVEAMKLIR